MKRIERIVMLICILCMLEGCGSKSSSELVNIEQFKCQDSIETVFDVLGETDMETNKYIGECYRYENLNLFGYIGEALFRVRDNKKTIQSFECNFKLNKKEFADVLSQLESKYGNYETDENPGQTAYIWRITEKEAEQLGYNRISFSDYGDKKATVDFSDEWSFGTDEAYYEFLSQDETAESDETEEVLIKKEYDLGNDDGMTVAISKKGGKEALYISANMSDEERAALAFGYFYSIVSQESMKEYETSIIVVSGEKTVTYSDGMIIGTGVDGKPISTLPDWVNDAINTVDIESKEIKDFVKTLSENMQDFLN